MGASMVEPAAQSAAVAVEPLKFDVRHLDFYYDRSQALKDVSLTLPDRRITAFIVPS